MKKVLTALSDDAVIRTFPYQLEFATNNTAENCLNKCAEFGYGAGGMEYGEQCCTCPLFSCSFLLLTTTVCGDVANVIAAGATLQPETGCNMLCTGNSSYYCGGPSRIQYYTWSGPALDLWDFKTGAAAGEYKFLIGGKFHDRRKSLEVVMLTVARLNHSPHCATCSQRKSNIPREGMSSILSFPPPSPLTPHHVMSGHC